MIPVYINVFNRLTTTRILAEQVSRLHNAVPIIVDNDSTWEPLLEWYESCPFEVIRLRENIGKHAPWLSGVVSQDESPFYVVTDCDLDLDGVPLDVLTLLQQPFAWSPRAIIKSGLSLRIDDLPPWQSAVTKWETQFWNRPVIRHPPFYWALIDTTFAMYSRDIPDARAMKIIGATSVRAGAPYTCRHVPWYLDCEHLDEENEQYFRSACVSNTWIPSGKGLRADNTRG